MSKNKKKIPEVTWLSDPEEHDYHAAFQYLSLHFDPFRAKDMSDALKQAETIERATKDLLRASALKLLPEDDRHVQKNLTKIEDGKDMVPVLIVVTQNRTYIADGYHRVCSLWHLCYDEIIPCRIVWEIDTGESFIYKTSKVD